MPRVLPKWRTRARFVPISARLQYVDGRLSAPSGGGPQGVVAVAGVCGVEVDAGLDNPVDAVEHGIVEHDVGRWKLRLELLHRARSDDRGRTPGCAPERDAAGLQPRGSEVGVVHGGVGPSSG